MTDIDERESFLDAYGLTAWREMTLIRMVEERLPALAKAGQIPGSTHPAAGMEAIAVGVSLNLQEQDVITSTHRGHAHCLARGADPGRVLAEVLGRRDGYCGGKGGSMHLASRELGILGANGIVGAGIGLATGSALAAKLHGRGGVAVAYFGDGATNQGIFHESLNLAAIWRLPCLFVCENNHYAQSSKIELMAAGTDLAGRAAPFGIPAETVDGMDVFATWIAARRALARVRRGEGPSFLVADTYRYFGHMIGDTEIYRTRDEVEGWRARDPITRLESELTTFGVFDTSTLKHERDSLIDTVDKAEHFALESPLPSPDTAVSEVYAARHA